MAKPVAKVQMTPKSVYFPQHEGKPAPTSHPASPGANAVAQAEQQQGGERPR